MPLGRLNLVILQVMLGVKQAMLVFIGGSSGLGLGLLHRCLQNGRTVLHGARRNPNIRFENLTHRYVDVTDETALEKFFELERESKITELIYCAGVTAKPTPIQNLDCDNFEQVLRVNTVGFARVIKYASQHFVQNNTRIVAIGSTASRRPSIYSGFEYTASKQALSGIIAHLASTFGPKGILVNAIHPGPVDTPMLREVLSPDEIESVVETVPTRRLTTVDDIFHVVELLLDNKNLQINGAGLDINGGQIPTA